MHKSFYLENRKHLYKHLSSGSMLLLFSGQALRKTGDEDYPFFADRSFVYYTGIEQADSILTAVHDHASTHEMLFLLPPDPYAERWNGKRLSLSEAESLSGIEEFKYHADFLPFIKEKIAQGITTFYLDFDRRKEDEQPVRPAYKFAAWLQKYFPYVNIKSIHNQIRNQRTIKKPCEIEAMRKAERITGEGIKAMMRAAKDGLYEYQLKAEYDYVLTRHGVLAPGFPSIISAGDNNFCIHYYAYKGQMHNGDMILNDVGACWDNEIVDVSRGWPVNGKFSDKQRLLYTCAYNTSNYMFKNLRPGLPMAFVDQEIRRYNFEQLKEAGVCDCFENIGIYMWHGGAHHIGYDVHDLVDIQNGKRLLEPGMVFCVDVGIYHEEWGIGFRLEDNCLITENGCENLSAEIPRSIEEIESFMGK